MLASLQNCPAVLYVHCTDCERYALLLTDWMPAVGFQMHLNFKKMMAAFRESRGLFKIGNLTNLFLQFFLFD